MSMPPAPPTPPSPTPNRSGNPGLVAALIISIIVALGAAAYGFLQSQSNSSSTIDAYEYDSSSSEDDETQRNRGVEIFAHVSVDTSLTSPDKDTGAYTYLQAHDDELSYCAKFDEATDGASTTNLLETEIYQSISNIVGANRVVSVAQALDDVMSIDNGLLTDLCNYSGEIYTLILSADLQTMTPYRLGTVDGDEGKFKAYSPILTPGGYGAIYFDHIPNTVVISTGQTVEPNVIAWDYYALDSSSASTDLIESCEREEMEASAVLTCSREYSP